MLLPQTLLPDIPVTIDGFSPQNYNLQFEGAVPADGLSADPQYTFYFY